MFKYIGIAVASILVAGAWYLFNKTGVETEALKAQIIEVQNAGDPEGEVPKLVSDLQGLEGERVFNGIFLAFISAGLFGIVFVTQVLPIIAQSLSHSLYDSGEEVEPDVFHRARVLMAQGNWESAIKEFEAAGRLDPTNRVSWIEIAKIQRSHLEDPQASVETLRRGIEGREWEPEDAAFLMFRLAESYDEGLNDRGAASLILEQIIEQFPNTRHSANAQTRLNEWGMA